MGRFVIGDIPRVHARRLVDSDAYVDGDRRLGWAEVDDRVNRLCHGLSREFGVGPGDVIAILAGNSHEYVELMYGASRLAASYTGLNTRHHQREIVAQLLDSGSKLVVVGSGFEAAGDAVAAEVDVPTLHLGPSGYETLLADSPDTPIASHGDEEAPYSLTYTSGTTGEPKGAMITSRNEVLYVQSLSWAAETRSDDRFMVVTPMFHKGGQFSTMHPAYFGLTTIILPGAEPIPMFEAVQSHDVTVLVAVPTVMKMMIDAVESAGQEIYDFSSLRHVLYGSNPITLPVLRRFAELFDCSLSQIGGIGTEGGVALVLTRVDHERALTDISFEHRLASCGRVQPGFELQIVDDEEQAVAPGQAGEMLFRGDAFISGYWGKPEASHQLWHNGWAHSGDIGRVDEDGYVYYVDRKAGRIKTGGETVFAREVEAALRTHPAIAEVAVVGVPDETWGEAVWAAVERRPDAPKGDDALAEELRRHVRQSLAGYKVPKRVVFIDALPRTALGKLAIGDIRATLATTTTTTETNAALIESQS